MKNVFTRSLLLLCLALTGITTGLGCAADAGVSGEPDGQTQAQLQIVGASSITLAERSEHRIEVRYTDAAGEPIAGLVDLAIVGEPKGATLSGMTIQTDANGEGNLSLRAGETAAFSVEAVAELAAPASVAVAVERLPFGTLEFTAMYRGERAVLEAEVALFTNVTCDDLSRAVPAPREMKVAAIGRPGSFGSVESGIPLAVFALGIDGGDNVAAEVCNDVTLSGNASHVELNLSDIDGTDGGVYHLEETFNVTSGFNPTLDLLLDMMTGLTTDPARYVVDLVASQEGTPGWIQTALSTNATRAAVATLLRDSIGEVQVPGYLRDVGDLGADVDRAFSQLTLDGTLTFDDADEFNRAAGVHRVTRIRFPLDSGISTRAVSASADVMVTVGDTFAIDRHQLDLVFGEVVTQVLNDVLYPRLPGTPRNTSEFLAGMLDCDSIAARLAGTGTTGAVTEAVCEIGLTLLGGYAEAYIRDLFAYDTLELFGTAELADTDGDYNMDLLHNGAATAKWMGEDGALNFDGQMDGGREATSTQGHPIRSRF